MAKEELECSFCGRKKPETNLLIAGLDAHICDRCIEQAHGIVIEESKQTDSSDCHSNMMNWDKSNFQLSLQEMACCI